MSKLILDIFTFRWPFRILILVLSFISGIFGLLSPFFQKEYIDHLTQGKSHITIVNEPWMRALIENSPLWLIFFSFVFFLFSQALNQLNNYIGIRESLILQKIFAEKLYKKTISLRLDTLGKRSVGEIVSLYATDIPGSTVFLEQTLPTGASTFFPLIMAPFAISYLFNVSLWPVITILILVSTINTTLAFRQSKFFFKFKQLAAQRTGYVNEWIQNIRTLRILNWMNYFEEKIFKVRKIETANRVTMVTNGQIMNSISASVTFFLNIAALFIFIHFSQHKLSGGEILALLWILGVFLTKPFRQMPWFFTFAFDSWTSLKRLNSFFSLENRPVPDRSINAFEVLNENIDKLSLLQIRGLNLTINGNKILSDINLDIFKNEFVAIIGEVGSGKSMLLLSLLQETGAHFDSYYINQVDALKMDTKILKSSFATVPQEGFIMSSSLRDNVAFEYEYLKDSDDKILKSLSASQFDFSLEKVGNGLDTEIGERGVNLSGGQKQRISLSRVDFYKNKILLLDDCLSAVDIDTEKELLKHLFFGSWKNETRVLVTHRLTVLDKVDRIIFLNSGKIEAIGNYTDLMATNENFRIFTQSILKKSQAEGSSNELI